MDFVDDACVFPGQAGRTDTETCSFEVFSKTGRIGCIRHFSTRLLWMSELQCAIDQLKATALEKYVPIPEPTHLHTHPNLRRKKQHANFPT